MIAGVGVCLVEEGVLVVDARAHGSTCSHRLMVGDRRDGSRGSVRRALSPLVQDRIAATIPGLQKSDI